MTNQNTADSSHRSGETLLQESASDQHENTHLWSEIWHGKPGAGDSGNSRPDSNNQETATPHLPQFNKLVSLAADPDVDISAKRKLAEHHEDSFERAILGGGQAIGTGFLIGGVIATIKHDPIATAGFILGGSVAAGSAFLTREMKYHFESITGYKSEIGSTTEQNKERNTIRQGISSAAAMATVGGLGGAFAAFVKHDPPLARIAITGGLAAAAMDVAQTSIVVALDHYK